MSEVVGLGMCCHDYICVIPYMPSFEEGLTMVDSSEQGGGPAGTALAAVSRLGVSASFIGQVGSDYSGQFIIDNFEKYGVDTEDILVRKGEKSDRVIVLVEESTGKRTFIGNDNQLTYVGPEELNIEKICSAEVLHLDGTVPPKTALRAAHRAQKAGVTVTLDAHSFKNHFAEILAQVDVFIPPRFICDKFDSTDDPREAAKRLLEYGPEQVIITLGERGCIGINSQGLISIPAFKMDKVVDTTGCGDVFHGGYIYALLQGWGMKRSMEFASACAALKCRAVGGRKGAPHCSEVLAFLNQRLPERWAGEEEKK